MSTQSRLYPVYALPRSALAARARVCADITPRRFTPDASLWFVPPMRRPHSGQRAVCIGILRAGTEGSCARSHVHAKWYTRTHTRARALALARARMHAHAHLLVPVART
eukprot:2393117-Pleurochrysis_carterae.AAC.1